MYYYSVRGRRLQINHALRDNKEIYFVDILPNPHIRPHKLNENKSPYKNKPEERPPAEYNNLPIYNYDK
jgi:hypothetical protein